MNRRIVSTKFKLDVDNVKVGISLPFTGKGVFTSTSTTTEQLKHNLIDLLMTNKGERFFDASYGCDLRRLLFEQIGPSFDVEGMILPMVDQYIPQIEITKISSEVYADNNLLIKVVYKIKHTSSEDVVNILI